MNDDNLIIFRLNKQDEDSATYRASVEKKLDRLIDQGEINHERMNERVRNLEQWRWITVGGIAMLTTLIGWYISLGK